MSVKFRLSDVDRQRLGITEEWLEYDPFRLMAREAAILHKVTGFDPIRLGTALQGKPKSDPETGEPLYEDVLDDDGQPVLDDDGTPKRERATDPDYDAWLAVVWLATVRAGYAFPYKTFDFDVMSMVARRDGSDDEGEASAPGTPGGSD